MRRFSQFVVRWATTLSILCTLLAVVGGYYSVQLYKNLRTDLEELLPSNARAVLDLNEVTHRLEAIDNLTVLVFTEDSAAGKRFIDDLAAKLQTVPKNIVASVEYRIDKELAFFKDRQAIYMDLPDLKRIKDYVRDRIDYEKQLYNPLNIFSGEDIPEPKLDFEAMRKHYAGKTASYDRFPSGYYATPDGKKRVMLIYLPGKTSSIDQTHALKNAVVKAIAELNPKNYDPKMEIHYTGGVQDTLEEHASLIADLELSTIVVTVIVTLAMLVFFRTVLATFALVGSIFVGTLWTFGASFFAVGYLNANSAFLGSIVLGNGINFGIIFLARYLEERRNGKNNALAVEQAIATTATATWTAALAAGLSYGSLVLTGFRGFRQFGVIGLIGMVLCWISAYVAMPAYLTVLDRIRPLVKPNSIPPKARVAGAVASLVQRFPRAIWGFSICLSIASVLAFTAANYQILETNLSKLRNKESIEHGSAFLSKYVDEIFQRYLSPLVILPHSHENAQKIAKLLKERKEREGPNSLIANVQTIDDFLPAEQRAKLEVIRDIRRLLPPKIVQKLDRSDQEKVATLLRSDLLQAVNQNGLPPLLLSKFTERDGTVGKLVLVEPPLNNLTWEGMNLIKFIHALRDTADAVEPGAAVAGALPITSDMIEAISRDGPRATGFALAAVVLLVVVLFRHLRTIALTLFALFMGVLWLAGVILGFKLKINFLNFIALPITFGIGVDYGVNIFQRFREEGGANIIDVIRNTGGAVMLCSFTTITGYCSLLIAGNQGFVSFGTLAVAGELTCVTAAVVALPAFLYLRARPKSPSQRPEPRPQRSPELSGPTPSV